MDACTNVAESGLDCVLESHIPEGFGLQRDGIVKEFLVEENPGNTVSPQHYTIGFLRIGSALLHGRGPVQHQVILCRRTLDRQHLLPPLVDLRHLGEETVSAHVHAVSFIIYGARDTAEFITFFENDDLIFAGLP